MLKSDGRIDYLCEPWEVISLGFVATIVVPAPSLEQQRIVRDSGPILRAEIGRVVGQRVFERSRQLGLVT